MEQIDEENSGHSGGEGRPGTGSKPRRLPLACAQCRKRKVKCSGEKPTCVNCKRWKTDCEYLKGRKKAPRQGYIDQLEKRLQDMQNLLSNASDGKKAAGVSGLDYRELLPENGFTSDGSQDSGHDNDDVVNPYKIDLPPTDIVQHFAEIFFSTTYLNYPFLHKDSFMKRLENGTVSSLLVFAICACAARCSDRPDIRTNPRFLASEPYVKKANRLLMTAYDSASLDTVQALLLLTRTEFGAARGKRKWMLLGIAIRMAMELHMDRESLTFTNATKPLTPEEWIDLEVRRRTYWTLFLIDRYQCAGHGRPHAIRSDEIAIQLPCTEESFNTGQPYTTLHLNGDSVEQEGVIRYPVGQLGTWAYVIRVTDVMGHVTTFMQKSKRKTPAKLPPWDPRSDFSAVDKMLQQFSRDLPQTLRYPEGSLTVIEKKLDTPEGPHMVYCNVLYHCCLVRLHRPALIDQELALVSQSIRNSQHAEFVRNSVTVCTVSADSMVAIMSHINSRLEYYSHFAIFGYSVYSTLPVQIFHFFSRESSTERAALAKQNLQIGLGTLKYFGDRWATVDRLHEATSQLFQIRHAMKGRVNVSRTTPEPCLNPYDDSYQGSHNYAELFSVGERGEPVKQPTSGLPGQDKEYEPLATLSGSGMPVPPSSSSAAPAVVADERIFGKVNVNTISTDAPGADDLEQFLRSFSANSVPNNNSISALSRSGQPLVNDKGQPWIAKMNMPNAPTIPTQATGQVNTDALQQLGLSFPQDNPLQAGPASPWSAHSSTEGSGQNGSADMTAFDMSFEASPFYPMFTAFYDPGEVNMAANISSARQDGSTQGTMPMTMPGHFYIQPELYGASSMQNGYK